MANKLISILILAFSIVLLSACSHETTDGGGGGGAEPVTPTADTQAPVIKVYYAKVDITGIEKITIAGNNLHIGNLLVASWTDNVTRNCQVSMKIDGNEVNSGSVPTVSGTLTLTVTDDAGNSTIASINLVLDEVHPDITVFYPEVNVYGGVTLVIYNGYLSIDDKEIMAWNDKYTQNCTVVVMQGDKMLYSGDKLTEEGILTVTVTNRQGKSSTAEIVLISKAPYKRMPITDLKPGDILPIVDQVEAGDKQIYNHIEHLRVAEATRIREMMWLYGSGDYSAEEYRQLMNRLNVVMMGEVPKTYTDYEELAIPVWLEPSSHAYIEFNILHSLVDHANYIVCGGSEEALLEYTMSHSDDFFILGQSVGSFVPYEYVKPDGGYWTYIFDLNYFTQKNLVLFTAAGNIRPYTLNDEEFFIRKVIQYEIETDEPYGYSGFSFANGKNDTKANRHLIGTFATDKNGDIDQTDEIAESSVFPIGFHNDVCFSGRDFPYYNNGKIRASTGKYATSFANYVNVAMASIAFHIKADIHDADELLSMLCSTSSTDYIRFEGQTQPLHLISLAGVIQKHLMPEALPTVIGSGEAIPLEPGYYHGVFFDIPGAEVLIDGEWVRVSAENEQLIKAQNPFTLKWRLSGEQLLNIGYKPGETVEGTIKLIDDKFGGLRLEKKFKVTLN